MRKIDLVTKYRPRQWSEVVGQEDVVRVLKNSLDWRSVLLVGPPGTGKTTIARILGMMLNCEDLQPGQEPCGKCGSCRSIVEGNAVDYREENVGDNRGINEVRALVEWLVTRPYGMKRKVLVLDEAHMLTGPAQNLLLKVIEEPPSFVTVVMCTTDESGLLETLKQRCSKFELKKVKDDELLRLVFRVLQAEKQEEWLQSLPEQQFKLLFQKAEGSPRNLLMLLEVLLRGGSIDEFIEDKVQRVDSLIQLVLEGRVMVVKDTYLKLAEDWTPADMLRILGARLKWRMQKADSVEKLLDLLVMAEALDKANSWYWLGSDGKLLSGLLVAAMKFLAQGKRDE